MTNPLNQDPDFNNIPRSHNLVRSSAINFFGRLATLLASVIATPFTIRLFGPRDYGIWTLLQSIIIALSLADLGMANSSTKLASEAYTNNDSNTEISYSWGAALIGAGFSSFIGIILLIFSRQLLETLGVEKNEISSASVGLIFIILSSVFVSFTNSSNTPQVIRLKWRSVAIVSYGPLILSVIVIPIFLLISLNVIVPCVIIATCQFLAGILNLYFSRKLQPAFFHPKFSKSLFSKLAYYGLTLTITNLLVIILSNAERFFLAHNHSATTLAYYSVAMSVAQVLLLLPMAVVQPLLPEVTRYGVKNDRESMAQTYSRILLGIYTLMIPVIIWLAYIAPSILQIWAGESYRLQSYRPLLILLVGIFFSGVAHILYNHFLATGKPNIILKLHAFEVVPYIVLVYFLTKHYGLTGAALSWTIRATLNSIVLQLLILRDKVRFRILPNKWIKSLLINGALALSIAVLYMKFSSIEEKLISLLVIVPVYAIGTWYYVLTPDERIFFKKMISQISFIKAE